jgi:alanyl-tRNA synthetase
MVELDRTAFYPGGGGQDPDVGIIAGFVVSDVQSKGGALMHKVPGNNLQVGQEVEGHIDWPRRFDLMRAHTGEHLLFSALKRLVEDLELVKIAITPTKKSFIVKGKLDWDIVFQAETMVNHVIAKNDETEDVHVGRDDPLVAESRVKLERIPGDRIRLVRIGDFDLAACAGVHVRRTGEIGMLLVEKVSSAKPAGDQEIEFKVGEEAVSRSLQLASISQQVSELYGAHPEDLLKALRNQGEELERARDSLRYYAKAWLDILPVERFGETSLYAAVTHGLDRKTLSEEATKRALSPKTACILVDEAERTLVVAVSKDLDRIDANSVLQAMIKEHGGKGGGNKTFASGGFSDIGSAESMLERGRDLIDKTP